MAGKKLSAAERLAKLQAMQNKRGKEFSGGKPDSEPPQKTSEKEKPTAVEVPKEGESEESVESGPSADQSTAEAEIDEDLLVKSVPDISGIASLNTNSAPESTMEDEAAPAEAGSDLSSPAELATVGGMAPSSSTSAQTRVEGRKPSSKPQRTLMSPVMIDKSDLPVVEDEDEVEVEEAQVPEGTRCHVHSSQNGEVTPLVVGLNVSYVTAVANTKVFMLKGPSSSQSVELAPGQDKEVEFDTPSGKVKVTMVNDEGEVSAYVVGGRTKVGHVAASAGKWASLLANVRYYIPELTMLGLSTIAASAVLWTNQWLADNMQNLHKPSVLAYGVAQLALTTFAFIEQRKLRKAGEAQEALKQ